MGKRELLFLVVAALMVAGVAHAEPESRLMRFPDIHGDRIVFTYGGDLWLVPAEGGTATRLTSHGGNEGFAKFSPDGETIAFTGLYDGNNDVYTIPVGGGVPKRLTYHSMGDLVVDWHPSGKQILFRSSRESKTNPGPRYRRLFLVGVDGGYPEALPLFEGELTSFSPDGTKIAYNRMSREFRTWKRYRGGMAQEIWLYDLKKNVSEKLTDFEGTDAFPMWFGDRVYFVSDRSHAMNIFCLDMKTREIRQITSHREYDVKWPSLGDGRIVYENGGFLYVLDLATEKAERIKVQVPGELNSTRPHFVNAAGMIRTFDLSASGKRAIFGARGEIFTVPAEKGVARNISRTSGVRERSPAYSPDGRWIAYFADETGEYELYTRPADGTGDPVRVTKGLHNYPFLLKWSPDSKKILFYDQTFKLYWADVEAKKFHVIDEDDWGDLNDFAWSHDSKWIAYSKRDFDSALSSIWLYSLDEGRSQRVTSGMYNDYDPTFDPGGKYLFFVSDRSQNIRFHSREFDVDFPYPSTVCVLTLAADTPSLLAPESDEVEVKEEEKKDENENGDEKKKKNEEKTDEEKKDEEGIKIDFDGIEHRVVALPLGTGNFIGLYALEGKLLFAEVPSTPISLNGMPGSAELKFFDFKEREAKTVIAGINGYDVSADGKKIIYSARGQYGIIDVAPGKKVGDGSISTAGLTMKLDPRAEWAQMFNEAWRLERDFFYVDNMHGVDWDAMKKRYEQFIPYLTSRDDLNYVIGELIAELCVGHSYVGGGDYYPSASFIGGGKLGCDLEIDSKSGRYRISKIYGGRNWDPQFIAPLAQPGIAVEEGNFLLAINGVDLKYPTNPYELLEGLAGEQTIVTVGTTPGDDDPKDYTVVPVASDINLRYDDWVEGNRLKTLEASGGKIGYIHVPSTAVWGLVEFARQFYAQARMEGIVVDVRYNSGGWMPTLFTDRLSRRISSLWGERYGRVNPFPVAAPVGHMACIINERAGSGGDAFPFFFRQNKLGPLVGKRTWGGLVGMNRNLPLVDGGMVTVPTVGFMNLDEEYDVENEGIAPDIEVENMPDEVVKGRDPQLERTIEYLMQKISEDPPRTKYTKPKDPDKS
ncbi:MAG: PD40 domain-containing protein [Candidatus Krumholzibacteriota bacterium]|nr:PD40 domain-containing protein [Candidatus Krumholzibacteriota bacterium]